MINPFILQNSSTHLNPVPSTNDLLPLTFPMPSPQPFFPTTTFYNNAPISLLSKRTSPFEPIDTLSKKPKLVPNNVAQSIPSDFIVVQSQNMQPDQRSFFQNQHNGFPENRFLSTNMQGNPVFSSTECQPIYPSTENIENYGQSGLNMASNFNPGTRIHSNGTPIFISQTPILGVNNLPNHHNSFVTVQQPTFQYVVAQSVSTNFHQNVFNIVPSQKAQNSSTFQYIGTPNLYEAPQPVIVQNFSPYGQPQQYFQGAPPIMPVQANTYLLNTAPVQINFVVPCYIQQNEVPMKNMAPISSQNSDPEDQDKFDGTILDSVKFSPVDLTIPIKPLDSSPRSQGHIKKSLKAKYFLKKTPRKLQASFKDNQKEANDNLIKNSSDEDSDNNLINFEKISDNSESYDECLEGKTTLKSYPEIEIRIPLIKSSSVDKTINSCETENHHEANISIGIFNTPELNSATSFIEEKPAQVEILIPDVISQINQKKSHKRLVLERTRRHSQRQEIKAYTWLTPAKSLTSVTRKKNRWQVANDQNEKQRLLLKPKLIHSRRVGTKIIYFTPIRVGSQYQAEVPMFSSSQDAKVTRAPQLKWEPHCISGEKLSELVEKVEGLLKLKINSEKLSGLLTQNDYDEKKVMELIQSDIRTYNKLFRMRERK